MSKIKNDPSFIYENTAATKAALGTKPLLKVGLYPSVSGPGLTQTKKMTCLILLKSLH